MTHGFEHIVLNRKPRPYDHKDWQLSNFITPEMRETAKKMIAGGTVWDWQDNRILDQGNTPHCVGFAHAGNGIAEPIEDDWTDSMGDTLYYRAKDYDGESGQENGSSTLSGIKAFMDFASVPGGYAWAATLDDIVTWVLIKAPVVTGTDWHNNMFYPDADGLVHIGGGVAGGHEWMITGVDTVARQFHCVNSWGTGFGVGGKFKIGFDDYQVLFDSQGDAVTCVEASTNPVPPTPTPTPTPVPNDNQWLIDLLKKLLSIKGLPKWVKNILTVIIQELGG